MADDLDDFFNDVEEAAAEAVKEVEETQQDPSLPEDEDEKEKKEVKEDEKDGEKTNPEEKGDSVSSKDDEQQQQQQPPAKRTKLSTTGPPIRPRGVVVAASSSVVKHKPTSVGGGINNDDLLGSASVGVHMNHNNNINSSSSINNTNFGNNQPLPGVTSIPPPPPPPPLPPLPQNNLGVVGNSTANGGVVVGSSKKVTKRIAAGKVWVDPTLEEWPENDFRIFCGNLDRSTTDAQLYDHFKKYPSIAKAKVVKEQSGLSKGFGFVSFLQPLDCAKAIREMDQTWLGSRPIRVKRSDWKDRSLNQVIKKNKKEAKQRKRFGL